MKIRHDRESGAIYIELREGVPDHTEDLSEKADVYLDVDVKGRIIGLEALSFDDLAEAIEEHGGELDIPLIDDLSEITEPSEKHRVFKAAFNALPDDERKVLNLRFFHGISLEETASYLSLSPEQVRQLMVRAMRNMRKSLSRAEGYENMDEESLKTFLRIVS